MSALNILRLKNCVIMLTDAAAYDSRSGRVMGFGTKQATVPSWPGALATRGAQLATPLYASLLSFKFQTWDEMVAGIESEIEGIHKQVKSLCLAHDGHHGADEPLDLAGWSQARSRPESYTLRVAESDTPSALTLEDETEEGAARAIQSERYKLFPLKAVAFGPIVSQAALERTRILYAPHLNGPDLQRALILLLCEQRKNLYLSRSPDGEPFSGVGGFALMSVVDKSGVRQAVLGRWPQDKVGEKIETGISNSTTEGKTTVPAVEKRTGNGKDAPAPVICGIGGTHGDFALRGEPYATPPIASEPPPSGMDVEFNPWTSAPNVYGAPAGPEYAGYEPFGITGYGGVPFTNEVTPMGGFAGTPFTNEPFATEGYPVTYPGPIGPEYAGYEPFALEGYPFTNEAFATDAAYPDVPFTSVDPTILQPGQEGPGAEGWPMGTLERAPSGPAFPSGRIERGPPLGEIGREAIPTVADVPVLQAGQEGPGMGGYQLPLDIRPQGAEPLPQEGYEGFQAANIQYPEAIGPRAEDFVPELNIPPSAGQPPAQTYEQAPLGEITGEPFATGEGVEYPSEERPSVAGATDAETEERVAQSAETANVVMGRAADKVHENPLATRGDKIAAFNEGARALERATRGDPKNPTDKDSPRTADAMRDYFAHMSDREKIAYIDAINRGGRDAQDATRNLMHAALGSEYFIGSRAAYAEQKGYLGPEQYQQIGEKGRETLADVHARSEANLAQIAWGGTDWGARLAAQRAAETPPIASEPPPSGMDVAGDQGLAALGGAWAAPAPMSPPGAFGIQPMPPSGAPPWTVYSTGFPPSGGPPAFPPGVHEIPGAPPSVEPPAVPGTQIPGPPAYPSAPAPSAPPLTVSPSPGGLQPPPVGVPSPADLSYFADSVARDHPFEVQQIAMKYRVPIATAALMFVQMMQQGGQTMAEGGQVKKHHHQTTEELLGLHNIHVNPTISPNAPPGGWPWISWGEPDPASRLTPLPFPGVAPRPTAFDAWLRGLPESENVEDRRDELSDEEVLKAYGYRKEWK